MKLIFAGLSSPTTLNAKNYQWNCYRNVRCSRPFLVPFQQWSDLAFFADFSTIGKPDSYTIDVFDVCSSATASVTSTLYVVAQKPDNSWYGVFGELVTAATYKSLYLRFSFTVGANTYIYYTEQLSIPACDPLMKLQGCYPNEPAGSNATDYQGIYYGYHAGPGTLLGTSNYRYFHWAFLRLASVFEQQVKFTFTAFKSQRTYRSVMDLMHVLEFELVPEFFQKHLLSIFARGDIRLNTVQWRLMEEQTFKVLDYDSKLWQMDMQLIGETKLSFGCDVSDCTPIEITCCDPVITSASVVTNNPEIIEDSNIESGDHTTRTQTFHIGPNVVAGNRFDLTVYSHTVEYVAVLGDTPDTVAAALRAAINATTPTEWNDHGSAPAGGTPGYPPTATGATNQIIILLNWGNSFAGTAFVS